MPDPNEIRVQCYEINGEGERSREHVVVGELVKATPGRGQSFFVEERWGTTTEPCDCAEIASREFDNDDMNDDDDGCVVIADFDYTSRIIEVVGHPAHLEPVRFRVRCEVKREYTAEETK